ncbi:MAG: GntR family transcriptional regulator [Novosphingobium sp.]|nr:GntR family transcriptional regulator [Novosphingobium sp.]
MKRERPKLSRELAARIIAQIIEHRMPDGAVLGTEADLLRRFAVSRGTFREALRQLEWQGIVRMQRGITGGLRVATPGSYVPMVMLKVYFELAKIAPKDLRQAFRAIQLATDDPQRSNDNPLLGLLARAADGQFIAALDSPAVSQDRKAKLNERVAYQLTLEIEDRALQPGELLGSEADLLKRTNVGRGVLREALNLMELNEVIELRRGPGGGAFVDQPTGEFPIYVTSAYLARAVADAYVIQAQSGLLLACGHQPEQPGQAGVDAAALHAQARDAAERQANPALRLFLRILERYWRDFAGQRSARINGEWTKPI